MKHQENTRNEKARKPLLIGTGILFAVSVIAGLVWEQIYIPLGCAFVLGGILLLSMKLNMGSAALTFCAYASFIIMLVVGAVLLGNGLSTGFKKQDNRQYTQSLGVSAEEVLAITHSEGTKYAVVMDGVLSRHLLPEEYQAREADDIGAVLIITSAHKKTGAYSNGGRAYRTDLTISLKSLKTGEIIRTATLYGEEPPRHVRISPLDPNKDRYGKPASDQSISSCCVSLIQAAQGEEERQSRTALLSGEELLEVVRRAVTQSTGKDGWAREIDVNKAIKEEYPDFSIKDYGYSSLTQYCKSDARFAVKERDLSNAMEFFTSLDYVRWTGRQ